MAKKIDKFKEFHGITQDLSSLHFKLDKQLFVKYNDEWFPLTAKNGRFYKTDKLQLYGDEFMIYVKIDETRTIPIVIKKKLSDSQYRKKLVQKILKFKDFHGITKRLSPMRFKIDKQLFVWYNDEWIPLTAKNGRFYKTHILREMYGDEFMTYIKIDDEPEMYTAWFSNHSKTSPL